MSEQDEQDEIPAGGQAEQGASNVMKGAQSAIKHIGQKAGDGANIAKNALKGKVDVKGLANAALKKVGKKLLTIVSLKLVLIVIFIMVLIALIVFFTIEIQKASAGEIWCNFIDAIAQSSENYKTKGYKSMGGLLQSEFDDLLARIDTGQLKVPDNLTAEEKENFIQENKQRQISLKEVSTDQERERLKKYLQADRESTLKAHINEKSKTPSFIEKFFDLFNEAEVDAEKKDKQRLKLINHTKDFDILTRELKKHTSYGDLSSEADRAEHDEKIKKIVDKIKGQFDEIEGKLCDASNAENNKSADPDYMKRYTEIKLKGSSSGDISIDSINVLQLKEQDEIFKLLDSYALSWKVLYLIDKALDEDEFDDFKSMENYTPETKDEVIKSIKDKFIRQAIPRFMPAFTIERHLKIEIKSNSWRSWPRSDCDKCTSSHGSSLTIDVTPVYKLVSVDAWNKLLKVPTAEKESENYDYERTDNDNGSGNSDRTRTFTYQPVDAPYDDTNDENKYSEKTVRKSNGFRTTGLSSEYSVTRNNPNEQKVTNTKVEEVKKIFTDIYGENSFSILKYDVEHMLYLTTEVPGLSKARCDIAVAFGISNVISGGGVTAGGYSSGGNIIIDGVNIIMRSIVPLDQVDPKVNEAIAKYSTKYEVDVNLIRALINQESSFNPNVNADGLMQIIPSTAKSLGITDARDIDQNVDGGVRYFKQKLDAVHGDAKLALVAYNCGSVPPGNSWEEIYNNIPRHVPPGTGAIHQKYPGEVLGAYMQYKAQYPNLGSSGTATGSGSDGTSATGGQAEKLPWDEVKKILPSSQGSQITVIDVKTNKQFNVLRYGGSNHADVVPATPQDTAIIDETLMADLNGDIAHNNQKRWNWRPVVVIIDGRKIAAARHSMPHGKGIGGVKPGFTILEPNGYDHDDGYSMINGVGQEGHFCIHFYGSMNHGGNSGVVQVIANAQAAVEQAADSNISFDASFSSGIDRSDYCYGAESGGGCLGAGCIGTNSNAGANPIILDGVSFPLATANPQEICDRMGPNSWFGKRKGVAVGRGWSSTNHQGVDLSLPEGAGVLAFADGVVTKVSNAGLKSVEVTHEKIGLKTRYLHVKPGVAVGQQVVAGQQIAQIGPTDAYSSGPHLHFETYDLNKGGSIVDPCIYLKKFGSFDGHNVL